MFVTGLQNLYMVIHTWSVRYSILWPRAQKFSWWSIRTCSLDLWGSQRACVGLREMSSLTCWAPQMFCFHPSAMKNEEPTKKGEKQRWRQLIEHCPSRPTRIHWSRISLLHSPLYPELVSSTHLNLIFIASVPGPWNQLLLKTSFYPLKTSGQYCYSVLTSGWLSQVYFECNFWPNFFYASY